LEDGQIVPLLCDGSLDLLLIFFAFGISWNVMTLEARGHFTP